MATPALQKARAELCVRLARVTVLRASMRPLAKLCEPAALPRQGDKGVGVCCEQAQEAGRASPPSRIGPLRRVLLPTPHGCHLPPALRPPHTCHLSPLPRSHGWNAGPGISFLASYKETIPGTVRDPGVAQ